MRNAHPCLAALTTLALLPCLLAPAPVLANGMAEDTAVLGLEGEGDVAGALTSALRKQLERRGIQGEKQMTLVELKLTMGCEGEDVGCISEGGKTLEVEQLIYGSVEGGGDELTVKLNVLDVGKAKITNGLTTTLSRAELESAQIDDTAADLVTRLLGPGPDAEPSAVPLPAETAEGVEPPPKEGGRVVWGVHKPIARWKLAGLGVSGGLFAGSLATAIATSLVIRNPNGWVYKELIGAAEDSLQDDKPENDVDPDMSGDLCAAARVQPNPEDEPGAVTNAKVTQVCNKAEALATTANVAWITTGVFGVATVAFTVLLFAHKEKPGAQALRRHDLKLGAAPMRQGGAMVGGSFDF